MDHVLGHERLHSIGIRYQRVRYNGLRQLRVHQYLLQPSATPRPHYETRNCRATQDAYESTKGQ